MRCPFCHNDNDKVIDSRSTEAGAVIRRRRECAGCKRRFTTYERVEEQTKLTVIKKDDSRVPYERNKVLQGMQKACYKRPVPAEVLVGALDEIEEELFRRGERELASTVIGDMVRDRLKKIDQVAYLRFASVYMNIGNLDDLLQEMQEVKETAAPPEEPDQGKLFDE